MEPDVQLSLPREPARLLAEADDFSAALNSALETLAGAPRVPRCSVTLFNPDIGQIDIQASCGLNARERGLGSYAPGECATGSVIASGAPPRVADAGSRERDAQPAQISRRFAQCASGLGADRNRRGAVDDRAYPGRVRRRQGAGGPGYSRGRPEQKRALRLANCAALP